MPLSQRSYRWEKEHVEELYQDINASIHDNLEEYFLGSIVGIKAQGKTSIYDGQQRLATTMILIAAMRDYFYVNHDEKTARIIEGESLFSERREGEAEDHFVLNAEDHQYFSERVLLRPDNKTRKKCSALKESHKRIEEAAVIADRFVKTIIAGLSATRADKQLNKWLNYIKDSLRVIWVHVGDERTAFTIFETMNDRGLKLSAADLLKNYLYALGDDKRDQIIAIVAGDDRVLETIEDEADNVVEYIRCFWITGHGHTRTKSLYDEIKKETTNKGKALSLMSDLEAASQDYAAILLSSHERLAPRGATVKSKIGFCDP